MTASESVQLRLELGRAHRARDDAAALRIIQRLDEERRAKQAKVCTDSALSQHIEVRTTRTLEDETCALCLDNIDAGALCERHGGRHVHLACGAAARRTRG